MNRFFICKASESNDYLNARKSNPFVSQQSAVALANQLSSDENIDYHVISLEARLIYATNVADDIQEDTKEDTEEDTEEDDN